MTKKRILIIGGGGHAKVVIDAIRRSRRYDICGILDPNLKEGSMVLGEKVLGPDGMMKKLRDKGVGLAFLGVGSVGDCSLRKKLYAIAKDAGFSFPAIVHDRAVVADGVILDEGTFVAAGAVVNPGTVVGRNAIINTASSVDHDCVIGDFVHIAPGATLSGGVIIGEESHIGTGANIVQCVKIGSRSMVGAGQTIRHDIADGVKSYLPDMVKE